MATWIKIVIIVILSLIALIAVLLILATLDDFKPKPVENLAHTGKAPLIDKSDRIFTIQTWNIGYFGLGKDCDFFYDGGKMTRPSKEQYREYSSGALKYLTEQAKADFYFFQEVDERSRRSYNDNQVERFREVFPGMESAFAVNYDVAFVPVPFTNPMGKVKSGLLVFSAFHSEEYTRYAFPGGYSWPKQLFMLDRCFLLSRFKLPGGKELVLINTHNEAFDNGDQRRTQLAVLKDLMLQEYEKGNYVVTGGDWNQNPVGYSIERLQIARYSKGFENGDLGRVIEPAIEADFFPPGWQWVFDPSLPTNRDVIAPFEKGKTKTTIIDFFVVSPNVNMLDVKTIDLGFQWADHQPVRMTMKL